MGDGEVSSFLKKLGTIILHSILELNLKVRLKPEASQETLLLEMEQGRYDSNREGNRGVDERASFKELVTS